MSIPEIEGSDFDGQVTLPDYIDKPKLKDVMIYRSIGYTQSEIAEEVDVSQRTVSRYLNEVKDLSARHENPKAVFYGIFISIFADKLTEVLTLMVDFSEKPEAESDESK